MKRTLSLFLVFVMVLAGLAGCGSERDAFIGTWSAKVELAEAVNNALGADADTGEYFSVETCEITIRLTFSKDGTYALAADEASVQAALDGMMDDLADGLVKLLAHRVAEDAPKLSVEEWLEQNGLSPEALIEEQRLQWEGAGLAARIEEEFCTQGKFEVKDGKLLLSAGSEYAVDESVYDTYTLEGNTLTLLEHIGTDSESGPFVYPMIFTKEE